MEGGNSKTLGYFHLISYYFQHADVNGTTECVSYNIDFKTNDKIWLVGPKSQVALPRATWPKRQCSERTFTSHEGLSIGATNSFGGHAHISAPLDASKVEE